MLRKGFKEKKKYSGPARGLKFGTDMHSTNLIKIAYN